jgi:hypothetical protein
VQKHLLVLEWRGKFRELAYASKISSLMTDFFKILLLMYFSYTDLVSSSKFNFFDFFPWFKLMAACFLLFFLSFVLEPGVFASLLVCFSILHSCFSWKKERENEKHKLLNLQTKIDMKEEGAHLSVISGGVEQSSSIPSEFSRLNEGRSSYRLESLLFFWPGELAPLVDVV